MRIDYEIIDDYCNEVNKTLRDMRQDGALHDYRKADHVKALFSILAKAKCLTEDGGYSGAGEWEANGMYGRDYDRGSSYRRDSMGRYTSRGYSRDGGYSGGTMQDHLDAMLRDARTEEERRMIEDMRRKMM